MTADEENEDLDIETYLVPMSEPGEGTPEFRAAWDAAAKAINEGLVGDDSEDDDE